MNVDATAFTDGRFGRLAQLMGYADADHARGKVEHLWLACTMRGERELPLWLVEQLLGPAVAPALVESELARWGRGRGDSNTRRLYICGSEKRTGWYAQIQEQSSKGGKARAASASRSAGKFNQGPAGTETSPLTLAPDLALTPALAPDLAPAPELDLERPTRELASTAASPLKAKVDRLKQPTRIRLPDDWAPERTEANQRAEQVARARGVDTTAELLKLHDWARSNNARKADWNATWRNWTRNAKSAGRSYQPNQNPTQVALDELDRIEREERQRRESA